MKNLKLYLFKKSIIYLISLFSFFYLFQYLLIYLFIYVSPFIDSLKIVMLVQSLTPEKWKIKLIGRCIIIKLDLLNIKGKFRRKKYWILHKFSKVAYIKEYLFLRCIKE